MTTTIQKEWAAVDDNRIVERNDVRQSLLVDLRGQGLDPDDYEIVALPKPSRNILL